MLHYNPQAVACITLDARKLLTIELLGQINSGPTL